MINGHTINSEMVEKVINNFCKCGRVVNADGVRREAQSFYGSFDSATECVEMFKSIIWNKGLIN